MKIVLVGFKLSIGNELYMEILREHFLKKALEVVTCGEEKIVKKWSCGYGIGQGNNAIQMFKDTVNLRNYLRFVRLLRNEKPDFIYFVSSHTLNNIAIILAKIYNPNIRIISHIHDPKPHSGTSYSFIIWSSQMLQCWLSDKILVYGKRLSQLVKDIYKIDCGKIQCITHGTYRREIKKFTKPEDRIYISLLGRVEEYKGIDVFLRAAALIVNTKLVSSCRKFKFIIGGAGDLERYRNLINDIPAEFLEIRNYLMPNDEFDDILRKSYVCVLPYKDATQTGNIQIAYYNSCPVIVTNVGSLPELVDYGQTGFIIPPNNVDMLKGKIVEIITDKKLQSSLATEAFNYYVRNLKWSNIINNLIVYLKESIATIGLG